MRPVPTSVTPNDKLIGIQFGRGIAASLVVFYHAGRMLALPQYIGHVALDSVFMFGNAGVDFFFTLSGFIIFWVHQRDIDKPRRLGRYVWRRVTRIYPMYWLVTALLIGLAFLKSDWEVLNPERVARSLLLIHDDQDPILGVGWTLTHEVLFYAVFAIAILSRKIGAVLAVAWLGFVCWSIFFPQSISALRFLATAYHVQFAFGAFAAYVAKKWRSASALAIAIVGFFFFALVALLVDLRVVDESAVSCRLFYGFASMLMIYGVAVCEYRNDIRFPRWAEYLGAASYSIYLVHTIAIGLLGRVFAASKLMHVAPDLSLLGISVSAIVIGCMAYSFVESPIQRSIRRFERLKPVST